MTTASKLTRPSRIPGRAPWRDPRRVPGPQRLPSPRARLDLSTRSQTRHRLAHQVQPADVGQRAITPYERVVDRAIQVWGAAGVSGDLPLAAMYQGARTLRIADRPDEVHRILIAKNMLSQYHRDIGWDFGS